MAPIHFDPVTMGWIRFTIPQLNLNQDQRRTSSAPNCIFGWEGPTNTLRRWYTKCSLGDSFISTCFLFIFFFFFSLIISFHHSMLLRIYTNKKTVNCSFIVAFTSDFFSQYFVDGHSLCPQLFHSSVGRWIVFLFDASFRKYWLHFFSKFFISFWLSITITATTPRPRNSISNIHNSCGRRLVGWNLNILRGIPGEIRFECVKI